MALRTAPPPGQAPLPAPDAAALFRRNAADADLGDRAAILSGDSVWSYREYLAESTRYAQLFRAVLPADKPLHVAVLLDNVPEYLFALGGAALSGAVVVGLNHTRRDEHLLRDAEHTHCSLVITERRHLPLLGPIIDSLPPVLVLGDELESALAAAPVVDDLAPPGGVESTWMLIFTSGTSSAPKGVICTQRRLLVTGSRMTMLMGIERDDVGYICMPLFHSNALMVGWAPAIVAGAAVGLGPRFSASRWLDDIRRYGATWFNYTGKPLSYLVATPERPDDADNTLRVAYGNEGSPEVVARFAERFGVEVIDAFGATEGGLSVQRMDDMPTGSVGMVTESVKVVDPEGNELSRARFDAEGRLVNADECVGEIVSTAGAGPFEGYYNNDEATAERLRGGWYWSGDLGYVTDEGWLYFAGRTADWIRVDGENFPAGPIEAALVRHPDVVVAAVYGVPDVNSGDQVMAAVVLRDGASFDPSVFAEWLDAQHDIGPKWRPRYVRVMTDVPTTGTNKIVKRTLVHQQVRRDRVGPDELWVRERGEPVYRVFGADDEADLEAALATAGRQRFWDL